MKRMAILFLICFSIGAFAQKVKLKLASDVWPPFTNTPGQTAVAIDLVKEGLRRAGVEAESEIIDSIDVIDAIRQGVSQGSAALWKNAEREDIMVFSAPYLQNQLVLVGMKGANVSARKLSELVHSKVAVVGWYAYGPEVEEASKVTFVKGQNDQENLEKLLRRQVDYILVDNLLIQYLVTHQSKEVAEHLAIGAMPLFTRSLHFAIRKDVAGADKIMQQFNAEITKMTADGTYNRILQLNWIHADVDGDGLLELVAGAQAGLKAPTSSYHVYFDHSKVAASNTNRYYVNGRFYFDWETVPSEYKVAPIKNETPEKVTLLKFTF